VRGGAEGTLLPTPAQDRSAPKAPTVPRLPRQVPSVSRPVPGASRPVPGASRPVPGAPRPILGVDTGGTFTDLALRAADGGLRTAKVASTPDDPGRAVLAGLEVLGDTGGAEIVHGTTVALNALLTGRTARTALVTNRGFRDLLEIGRQARPDIYALHPVKPRALVPRERRFEVTQRSWPGEDGTVVEDHGPGADELASLARAIKRSGAESVAVCLLHSYADPGIERRVAQALAPLGLPLTCSAELLPAYREVERFSTAMANAALAPIMSAYLERLARELPGQGLSLLQSSGGTVTAERAAAEPVRVLFSGPAGGVVGAARAAQEAGLGAIVTLDMGGTSTDVAFHDPGGGLLDAVTGAEVAGHPIAVPALDIHTIGCGGGSLVHVDAGGVLHVGPESAGADPGPVCYGQGEVLTVTDACVHLGHIASQGFLDGNFPLDVDAVARAFELLGRRLGTRPLDAAQGVLDVARAAMRRALGVRTMQRGLDPAGLPLVAFGGGGGLHAAALAAALDMPGALIPAYPGVLSAAGMAGADALRDRECSVLAPLAEWNSKRRRATLAELTRQARGELRDAGYPARAIEVSASLDLRYRGQSYELSVPEGRAPDAAFSDLHEARYGWRLPTEVELVSLRVRALARRTTPAPTAGPTRQRPHPKAAVLGERRAVFAGRPVMTKRIDRGALRPGHVVQGPAIIEEYSATTLVPPSTRALVRAGGHLWVV
jgi:N-methylhydantoinase A